VQERPLDSVKSFSEINLDNTYGGGSLVPIMTKKLLYEMDVISHLSTTKKCILSRIDDVTYNMSHTTCKNLRDDLINHIAARDRAEISCRVGSGKFRNQRDDGMIDLLKHFPRSK
jgi:hypothetical protein